MAATIRPRIRRTDLALLVSDHRRLARWYVDVDDLRRLYARLLDAGVAMVKTTDHGVGMGVYFEDRDGNRLEFFAEREGLVDGGKELFGRLGAPSDPSDLEPLRDRPTESSENRGGKV